MMMIFDLEESHAVDLLNITILKITLCQLG